MAAGEKAVDAGAIVDRTAAGAFDVVDPGDNLAGAHRRPQVEAEFHQTGVLAGHETGAVGHVEVCGRAKLRLAGQDSGMSQDVVHASFGYGQRPRARAAAATQLGRNEGLAERLGRGVVHAGRVDFQEHQAVGGIEGLHGGDAARFLFLVLEDVGGCERQKIQGPAARVYVRHKVGERQQVALEVVGDLFGHRAVGPARKTAVKVAAVDRRAAAPGAKGRVVHGRHDYEPARDRLGGQGVRQVEERDRSLVLVAVIAACQERGRAVAVLDHRDRDHDRAPGGLIARMGQLEKSMLDAVLLEVDGRGDGRGCHGPISP